jgi:hypothetical protein
MHINDNGSFGKSVRTIGRRVIESVGQRSRVDIRGIMEQGGRGDMVKPQGGCDLSPRLMNLGCQTDDCGRVFVRTPNGGNVIIRRPDSIRERPMSALVAFDTFVAATDESRDFTLDLAPDVRHFVPRRLILATAQTTNTAVPVFNLQNVILSSMKIGNREQIVGKRASDTGGTLAGNFSAGLIGTTFAEDSIDTQFDFDIAEPSLGVQFTGSILAAPTADVRCFLSFTLFGFSFES